MIHFFTLSDFQIIFLYLEYLLNTKNVSLISHGSHTIQDDNKLNRKVSRFLVLECHSLDKRIKLLSQSKLCDDYLDSLIENTKINFIISQNNLY